MLSVTAPAGRRGSAAGVVEITGRHRHILLLNSFKFSSCLVTKVLLFFVLAAQAATWLIGWMHCSSVTDVRGLLAILVFAYGNRLETGTELIGYNLLLLSWYFGLLFVMNANFS